MPVLHAGLLHAQNGHSTVDTLLHFFTTVAAILRLVPFLKFKEFLEKH